MSGTRPTVDLRRFGIAVGHATDAAGGTGCTVVRGDTAPLRGGYAIFGRATGTRELAPLTPGHLVDRVDAVLLTGGSAYGLAAADGVMRWMEERHRGFTVGGGVVPIVPGAVLFDLAPFGRFDARPTPQMGYDACETATSSEVAEGSVGAGTGLTVGKALGMQGCMKGGLGIATVDAGGAAACAARLRNYHLRGSSAINYEADIILILNEKYQIVAKVNIEFNPYQAQRFRDWVVISVEKNRGGQDNVDLEFEKHFEYSCFDPNGRTVQEKLIEERLARASESAAVSARGRMGGRVTSGASRMPRVPSKRRR